MYRPILALHEDALRSVCYLANLIKMMRLCTVLTSKEIRVSPTKRVRPTMLRSSITASTQVASGSNIAGGSMGKAWADKEHAAENQYFSRQDAENLAKLATKLHLQTAPNEEIITHAKEELVSILGKHSIAISDPLVDDLHAASSVTMTKCTRLTVSPASYLFWAAAQIHLPSHKLSKLVRGTIVQQTGQVPALNGFKPEGSRYSSKVRIRCILGSNNSRIHRTKSNAVTYWFFKGQRLRRDRWRSRQIPAKNSQTRCGTHFDPLAEHQLKTFDRMQHAFYGVMRSLTDKLRSIKAWS
eukprot:IDg5900t1